MIFFLAAWYGAALATSLATTAIVLGAVSPEKKR